jgi:hypothetical protein
MSDIKFYIKDSQRMQNCISHISNLPLNEGFHVTISNKKPRSLNQNDLWHKWIDLMAKEAGSSPDDMKIDVKRNILGMKESVNALTGEITYHDYSSAKLTKEQFSRLMIQTQVIASQYYGLSLPTPEDFIK